MLGLKRNPNYYRKGEPCLAGFQARTIKSGSVRILSLKKGDLDVINTFPESQFPQLKSEKTITVQEGKSSTLTLLPMNTKIPALKDKRVRQAIQYAVNGQQLIDNVYRGAGVMIESIFPSWFITRDQVRHTGSTIAVLPGLNNGIIIIYKIGSSTTTNPDLGGKKGISFKYIL